MNISHENDESLQSSHSSKSLYISCVWIFLHFPLQLYWLLQILQLSSFSWLFLGEKNTFPNLITSEIKLQFRAIYKMLNRTLKVKFLHKMLRDLLQYVQQFLATSHESAAVSTSSCAQNWFAEQLALRNSDVTMVARLSFTISRQKQIAI